MRLGIIVCVAAAMLLTGCKDGIPQIFRTDDAPVYKMMGGDPYAIPINFIDSHDADGGFFLASWPEMEGRTKEIYLHYSQDHVSILIEGRYSLEHSQKAIDVGFKSATERTAYPPRFPLKKLGKAYGFVHYESAFDESHYVNKSNLPKGQGTYEDFYVRRRADGTLQAYVKCDGVPALAKRYPQCSLFIVYPEFPRLYFKIRFDRSEALDQVNQIKAEVRTKFIAFRAAGQKAFQEDEDARKVFQEDADYIQRKYWPKGSSYRDGTMPSDDAVKPINTNANGDAR